MQPPILSGSGAQPRRVGWPAAFLGPVSVCPSLKCILV